MSQREKWYRILIIIFLVPLLILAGWCGVHIYQLSNERAIIKSDYAEVNNIQYGLLSVDAWRDNITEIVFSKIENFNFTDEQEDTLRTQINKILNALITQADSMINENKKGLENQLKKFAYNTFVDIDKVRSRVPEFTQTILNEIKKPKSKQKLKFLAKDKLSELAAETRDSLSATSSLDSLLIKYKAVDISAFNSSVTNQIYQLQQHTFFYSYLLLGIMSVFLILWRLVHSQKVLYTPMFVLSVILALIVLMIGISTPMIEIDARIKELNFLLIDKYIVFHDQVLFYQSKSILDVVMILVATKKIDSMFVGILILVFSVLFPIGKLLSTELYLLGNEKMKNNKIIQFFAFKSGKWSMADVMVVAIFMAYMGFKGILDSQLAGISLKTNSVSSIATNETSLQPGFILFLAFVIFSLILSVILKRISPTTKKDI